MNMNRQFKKILLNLVKLSRFDQRWVLNKLSPEQRERFNALQGDSLLLEARKFRDLSCNEVSRLGLGPTKVLTPSQDSMLGQGPTYNREILRQEDPLFIAIIINQGQFEWEQEFLNTCEHKDQIKEHLDIDIHKIKLATKSYLFQQWQSQLDFQAQLETARG